MKTVKKHETWEEKSTEFGHLLMPKYGHIALRMCRTGTGVRTAWLAELPETTTVEDSKSEKTTRG